MTKPIHVFVVALVVAVASIASVTAGPTGCGPHKGTETRCAKDDAGFDRVRVDSRNGQKVTFRVGFWISSCGWPGSNYNNKALESERGSSAVFDMEDTGSGKCREAFIYDCKLEGIFTVNCNEALNAYRI